MEVIAPKPLPANLQMPCYACETHPATHLCRYQIDELAIQICLCEECMKIDTKCLLKSTVGLQGLDATLPSVLTFANLPADL
jgi:hypothetical protein